MDESGRKKQKENKVTDIKIFSVPFQLLDKQKKITINTNFLTNPSKEKIIIQAINFHSSNGGLHRSFYKTVS